METHYPVGDTDPLLDMLTDQEDVQTMVVLGPQAGEEEQTKEESKREGENEKNKEMK